MRAAGLVILLSLLPGRAAGQIPDHPYGLAGGRVVFGAELAATLSKHDDIGFFNYTDYDHDALRLTRARLLGEWHIHPRLALLGEVRTENGDGVDVAALFVRWRPWSRAGLDIQIGRIPPVIGAFGRRAYGRDNPLIGTPLAYQYLTSLRPDALPASIDDVLRMRGRGWRPSFPIGSQEIAAGLPLVSAFRWDTGIEAHWRRAWMDLAGAVTRGSPAQPVVRETNTGRAWSGRAAVVSPAGWTVGVSGARGAWIDSAALALVPAVSTGSATQTVAGADVEWARARWIVRGEWIRSTFAVPTLAAALGGRPLTATSTFAEARYRFHPRGQIALRADRLDFSSVQGTLFGGARVPWDAPVRRIEATLGFRATRTIELRVGWQENWRQGSRTTKMGFPAVQALYWF